MIKGLTSDYGIKQLVWYELVGSMKQAILREKRLKKWNRRWKLELIERDNPEWRDLAVEMGLPLLDEEETGFPPLRE